MNLIAEILSVGVMTGSMFRKGGITRITKSDGTLQTSIDVAAEKQIVEVLGSVLLPAPILAEEDTDSKSISLEAKHQFFWSVDPIDGTSRLGASFNDGWSIAVGAVYDGLPRIGIVVLPHKNVAYATHNVGGKASHGPLYGESRGLLGLTLGSMVAKNAHYWEFNRRLIEEWGSMLSEPSVKSGIDFITGRTRLFVACNSSHWDLCAVAALALEQGAIVRHCDGTAIDWSPQREKLAPVLFARSNEDAVKVTRAYFDSYEYVHPREK
jgi:fructose-1,6-bisphosphatase/inositol monophosphatase family enzyme